MPGCGHCVWWRRKADAVTSKGLCTFGPPSVTFLGRSVWPESHFSDSCSRFQSKSEQQEVPDIDVLKTSDCNIINAIPNSAGYKLKRCRLQTEAQKNFVKKFNTTTDAEHAPFDSELFVADYELLGWLVVIDNGPFPHQMADQEAFLRRMRGQVPHGSAYPTAMKLLPITVSGDLVTVGYGRKIRSMNFSKAGAFDGIFKPGEQLITPLSGTSIPIPLAEFKQLAYEELRREADIHSENPV